MYKIYELHFINNEEGQIINQLIDINNDLLLEMGQQGNSFKTYKSAFDFLKKYKEKLIFKEFIITGFIKF